MIKLTKGIFGKGSGMKMRLCKACNSHIKKYIALGVLAFLLAGSAFLGGLGVDRTREFDRTDTAMGTMIHVKLYGKTDDSAEIMKILEELEQKELSRRVKGSVIWQINEEAGNSEGTLAASPLWEELRKIMEISQRSEGALDITVGDLVEAWNIDAYADQESILEMGETGDSTEKQSTEAKLRSFTPPSQTQIEELLAQTGYERVELSNGRIRLPEGMKLDLGAVGKGIACDRIADWLRGQKETSAGVISVGGSILTWGEKPNGTKWNVAVTDPFNTDTYIGTLELPGGVFVSTSGDYERYVEYEGKRYHHILDPKTGYPAWSGLHSVTIVSNNGLLSDALSTACFVLGEEKGKVLAESYGVGALFVREDGSVTMTESLSYTPK